MSILTPARPLTTREGAPIFTGRKRLFGAGLRPNRLRAGSTVGRPSPATLGHSIGDEGRGVGQQGTTVMLGRRIHGQAGCVEGGLGAHVSDHLRRLGLGLTLTEARA
jgi:hypothetical protein